MKCTVIILILPAYCSIKKFIYHLSLYTLFHVCECHLVCVVCHYILPNHFFYLLGFFFSILPNFFSSPYHYVIFLSTSYRRMFLCFCGFLVFFRFSVFSPPSSTSPLEVRLLLLALALVLALRAHAHLIIPKPDERLRLAIVHQKVLLTETALLPLGLVRHLPLQHLRYGLALEFLVHLLLPVRERCPCLGLLRLLRQVHWLVHWQVLHRGLLTVSRCLGHCRSRLAELRRRTLLLHHQLHPLGLLRRQLQAYRVGRRHIAMSLIALRTLYSKTPLLTLSASLSFNFISLLCRLLRYPLCLPLFSPSQFSVFTMSLSLLHIPLISPPLPTFLLLPLYPPSPYLPHYISHIYDINYPQILLVIFFSLFLVLSLVLIYLALLTRLLPVYLYRSPSSLSLYYTHSSHLFYFNFKIFILLYYIVCLIINLILQN